MPPLAVMGAMAAASAVAGALNNRKKKVTSSSTPTWGPEYKGLQDQLMGYSQNLMSDPGKGLEPIRTAGADRINRRYQSMPGKISQNMASRGYGSSGEMGNTMYQTEFARSGEMSDLEELMSKLMLDQQNKGATIGQNLLQMGRGVEGENITPGNVAGGALNGGLQTMSTMMALNKADSGSYWK
jgi:hypothetical protein